MTKRVYMLLMAIALVAALVAGCGGSGGDDAAANTAPADNGKAGDSQGPSTDTDNKADTQKEDTVKLTIGSWRTEDVDAYNKIIAAFKEKNPNIDIEFRPSKNTEYDTILNTSLQTGEGPDIIHLRPYGGGRKLEDAGYLEPLEGKIDGLDQFDKSTLSAATGSDGKVYGIPTVYSSTQIFYNIDLFKQSNIEVPKTWDDLIQVAKTLKSKGIAPFAFGSKEGWILALTHATLGPQFYGGNDFDSKVLAGDTNFKSKEFLDSIQMMKDLIPYFPDNYTGLGMDDMRNLFVTGQAGMIVMGDWEIAVMQKANPDLKLGMFPVPGRNGAQPSVTTWVDGSFAVNAKSKHKDAALKFLQFMTTKEFGTLVVNELKKPSTIKGVSANDPLVTELSKNADSISTPYLFVVNFNEGNPTSKTVLQDTLQGMYLGQLTPQQVADKVQESVDGWFKPQK